MYTQSASLYTDPINDFQFLGYSDPVYGVTYGLTFPPLATSGPQSNEFIGEVVAPLTAEWIGIALNGQMLDNLLVVAWPNAGEIIFSPRYATYVILLVRHVADSDSL